VRNTNSFPNQKKYVCSFKNCQKTYALKNILLAHLRTHYKIKPYTCTYCSKSFNEKGNLKTHIRIHTGERPFTCQKCHKSFKALGQLKDHFISHTGLKPFQCPFCKKFYRRKEILKNHFEIHKKDSFFVKNEEKYKEILDKIKKMKNMVLALENSNIVYKDVKESITNVVNNITGNGSGAETNLSSSMSSNEEPKESSYNNSIQEKNKKNKNKISYDGKEQKEKGENYENNNIFENNNLNKEESNFNSFLDNNLNPFLLTQNYNFDIKRPILPEIYIQDESNLDIKEKDNNNDFFCDDISVESKDFAFQNLPHISEKEISVSYSINNFNIKENIDKELENYDCYSKITDLYFQSYQNKKNLNL